MTSPAHDAEGVSDLRLTEEILRGKEATCPDDCDSDHDLFTEHRILASDVRVGDEILTDTYAGIVTMADRFQIAPTGAGEWPVIRLFVADQGGVARFPHELVITSRKASHK